MNTKNATIKKSVSAKTVAKSAKAAKAVKTAKVVKTAKKATAAKSARKAKKSVAKAKLGMISDAEVITSGYGGCKAKLPGGEFVWVPASHVSWTRPVSVPEVGESVRVKLIEKTEQGFKASMKVLTPDPFAQKFCVIHEVGDILPAKVKSANITGVGLEFDISGVYGSLVAGEVRKLLNAGGLPPVGSEIKVKIEEFHEPTRNVRVSLVEMPKILKKPSIAESWRTLTSGDQPDAGTGKGSVSLIDLSDGDCGQLPRPEYILLDGPNMMAKMLTDGQRSKVFPSFARAVQENGAHPAIYIKRGMLNWLRRDYPKAYGKVAKFCEQHDKVVIVESGCDDDEQLLKFLAKNEDSIAVSTDGYRKYLARYGEAIKHRVVPATYNLGLPGKPAVVSIPRLGIEFEL